MKDFRPHTIELDTAKAEFLEKMAATYALADTGKAIRA